MTHPEKHTTFTTSDHSKLSDLGEMPRHFTQGRYLVRSTSERRLAFITALLHSDTALHSFHSVQVQASALAGTTTPPFLAGAIAIRANRKLGAFLSERRAAGLSPTIANATKVADVCVPLQVRATSQACSRLS